MQLMFVVNKKSKEPIYMQLRNYIVDEIIAGRLKKRDKLISTRLLAKQLDISRTSIENAYNQLVAEGYIVSEVKKGYYVAELDMVNQKRLLIHNGEENHKVESFKYDFKSEYVAVENFDYRLWKKHLNYIINYEVDLLYAYGETRGEYGLRNAIADHFYRTRGVVANPYNIVIGGGISPLLSILMKLFNCCEIKMIGMEDPGFNKAKGIFEYSHIDIVPIEVTDQGINMDSLYETKSRACYVSPSHQFPTGSIMPIKNRQKLLKWATKVDGYIIEDDYNSELRFEGQPIPSMQGIDQDERVIYLGSFSTVLAPAIRVSFMVLPDKLNKLFDENSFLFTQTASKLEQLALSKLIISGDFERHIRKIRKNYARKQTHILECIHKWLPPEVTPIYGRAGLQIMLLLPNHIKEKEVIEACKSKSILIGCLSEYRIVQKDYYKQCLIVSYRGIAATDVEKGIRKLGEVISSINK